GAAGALRATATANSDFSGPVRALGGVTVNVTGGSFTSTATGPVNAGPVAVTAKQSITLFGTVAADGTANLTAQGGALLICGPFFRATQAVTGTGTDGVGIDAPVSAGAGAGTLASSGKGLPGTGRGSVAAATGAGTLTGNGVDVTTFGPVTAQGATTLRATQAPVLVNNQVRSDGAAVTLDAGTDVGTTSFVKAATRV